MLQSFLELVAQTLFDTLDIINHPPETIEPSEISLYSPDAVIKIQEALDKFKQSTDDKLNCQVPCKLDK